MVAADLYADASEAAETPRIRKTVSTFQFSREESQ